MHYVHTVDGFAQEILFILDPRTYTTSRLQGPSAGTLAHRNDLVSEIARVTGKSPDTNIPSYLRTNPKLFFEMFEQIRVRKAAMASSAATTEAAMASSAATTENAKSVVPERDAKSSEHDAKSIQLDAMPITYIKVVCIRKSL